MMKITSGPKLYEQMVEQVKSMISSGVYQKGDLLPSEKEWMEMTGVSRVTVREAMRLLSEAGVIATRHGKGSFVCIDGQELVAEPADNKIAQDYTKNFRESTAARLILEPEVAKQVALTATAEGIEWLQKALNNESFPGGKMDTSFHHALFEVLGNEVLLRFFEGMLNLENNPPKTRIIPPRKQKSISKAFDEQHGRVMEAIVNRNPDFAYFHMKEHLLFVQNTYDQYFDIFY